MLRKTLKVLILLSVVAFFFALGRAFYNSNHEQPLDCKILETYQESAGYKVSAKYVAVVRVIDLNLNTHLNLNPEGFYAAQKYKQSGQTVSYLFSNLEIHRMTHKHGCDTVMISLLIPLLLTAVFVIWYVVKFVNL